MVDFTDLIKRCEKNIDFLKLLIKIFLQNVRDVCLDQDRGYVAFVFCFCFFFIKKIILEYDFFAENEVNYSMSENYSHSFQYADKNFFGLEKKTYFGFKILY